MKVAIPSNGKDLDSEISEHFGRAEYFLVIEIENGKIKDVASYKNDEKMCIKPVHLIKRSGASVVITKNMGEKPYTKLKLNNIKIYRSKGKIRNAINELLRGELEEFREEHLHSHEKHENGEHR